MRGIYRIALALAFAGCASGDMKGDNTKPPPAASTGRPGMATVPAAIQARSAKYKLVGTVTIGNGWSSSTQFTKHGGVVGATQP